MDAVRFVQEFLRMCGFGGCTGCWIYAKKGTLRCWEFQKKYPEQTVSIVERWAEGHPRKTRKDDFFEKFPYAKKTHDGIPKTCVANLGYAIGCLQPYSGGNCVECWNRPLEGEGGKE